MTSTDPNPPMVIKAGSGNIRIDDARADDAASIARVGRETFEQSFGYSLPPADLAAYLESAYTAQAIGAELAEGSGCRYFVARGSGGGDDGNDRVVGFLSLKLGTTDPCLPPAAALAEVNRIYVAADQLGRGVGDLLLRHAIAWAERQLLHGGVGASGSRSGTAAAAAAAAPDGNDGSAKAPSSTAPAAVWLGVWEHNPKAQRFYRRYGFEPVGSHDFTMGDTTQTDLIMIKWL